MISDDRSSSPTDAGGPPLASGLFRPEGWSKARKELLPPEVMRLEAGSMIGEFRLLGPLGEGGMGSVWEAEQSSVGGRRVAVKVIRSDLVNEQMVRYFHREAETGGVVRHPGIVSVYGSGESGGVHYIAQELIGDGRTLSDWLAALRKQETALTPEDYREMAEFVAEVAEAVQAAHEAGVVHRDLKPQNILIDDEGNPRVTDFGLAKRLDAPSISGSFDLIGTYYYMSPEQAAAKSIGIDARTDIFSLGVVLYEMLTQRRPFDGDTREVVLEQVIHEDPAPPHKLKSRVPTDLSWISLKAMEKRREDRYASMAELAADLRRSLADEPIVARNPGPLRRAQKWVRRHPTTSTAAGVLGVAFAAVLVLLSVISGKNTELESTNEELDRANQTLTRTNQDLEESRQEARTKAREAEDELERRRRLSDLTLLRQLRAREERLWPARPQLVDAMVEWLEDAETLREHLPDHEAELARLRSGAAAVDEVALAEALARSARAQDFADAAGLMTPLRAELNALDAPGDPAGENEGTGSRAALEAELARLEALREEIEQASLESIRWRFPDDPDAQFRHDNLTELVAGIRALLDEESGLMRAVRTRLDRAERIEDQTVGEELDAWLAAMDGIASREDYGGWELPQEQVGLVPIGVDPESGLWEFWHVESGARPERDEETGRIEVTPEMGIVLVLIAGGTFWMGASRDPASPNHDPASQSGESPVHEVTLEPYFLSKYEVTQGQWFRLTGERPSTYTAGSTYGGNDILDSNPVTEVSWEDCARVLPRYGLRLPTEAQWERAARAGTSSPWWCGDLASIAGAEGLAGNVFDRESAASRGAPVSWGNADPWDDGYVVHAPVGTFRANEFGLYDVLGNVWEWCEDQFDPTAYHRPHSPEDGHRLLGGRAGGTGLRVYRGGSFNGDALLARSAYRDKFSPSGRGDILGVRPARAITLD